MTGPRPDMLSLPPTVVTAKRPGNTFPIDAVDAAHKLAGPPPNQDNVVEFKKWTRKVNTIFELLATTAASDSMPQYLRSALVDSMQKVMAKPTKYGTEGLRIRSLDLGSHTVRPSLDVRERSSQIDFNPRLFAQDTTLDKNKTGPGVPPVSDKNQLDWVAAHEHGHAFDRSWKGGGLSNEFFWTFYTDPKSSDPPPYKVKYRQPQDWYAGTKPGEHFAQAAANAFDFLRKTRDVDFGEHGKAKEIIRSYIDAREKDIPGTLMVINRFLQDPLYKKHPWRKVLIELYPEFYIRNDKK